MPQKRILFILHTPPPVHGSSVIGQVIKDSHLINKAFECSYINLGTSRTVNEIGKKPFLKVGRYLSIIHNVLKQLIAYKPNLCYFAITAKGPAFYKDSLIALLVKFFGVCMVYHLHNKGVSTRQHKTLDNFLYTKVFKNTQAILLSKYLYTDMEKYFTTDRVHYCPNGISPLNPPNLDYRHSNNYPKSTDKRLNCEVEILFLSNLIESKGVFVLLEACKLLQKKQLPFYCTLVGNVGNINEDELQKKIKKMDLVNSVYYAGSKYGIEKEKIFARSEIFAFPTYFECFPLVLLEAMQHSLPIVSTYEGGIPDVVENGVNGFLVAQKDANALAEKLELLIINKELRKEMGSNGRMRYEQYFTLKHFENNMTNILNKCLLNQAN